MKHIYLAFGVSMFTFIVSVAHAATSDFAQVQAAQMAMVLGEMKTPTDLLMLESKPLSGQRAAEVEMKSFKKQDLELPQISSPTPETVACKFSKLTVMLDFSRIASRVILVQNQPIKLESYKTLQNYKNEVSLILGSETKTGLFQLLISPALANGFTDWMSYYVGVAVHSEVELQNGGGDRYLADSIIDAYKRHLSDSVGEAHANPNDGWSFSPAVFSCKSGHLDTMNFSNFQVQGQRVQVRNQSMQDGERVKLVRSATGQYAFFSHDGKVSSQARADFLTKAPFFHFPEVADRCCAQAGCASKVAQAYQAGVHRELKTQKWEQHGETAQ